LRRIIALPPVHLTASKPLDDNATPSRCRRRVVWVKIDKETRRKLHAHRAMSVPVADKAGGYCDAQTCLSSPICQSVSLAATVISYRFTDSRNTSPTTKIFM